LSAIDKTCNYEVVESWSSFMTDVNRDSMKKKPYYQRHDKVSRMSDRIPDLGHEESHRQNVATRALYAAVMLGGEKCRRRARGLEPTALGCRIGCN
jgi:hypothetical protein